MFQFQIGENVLLKLDARYSNHTANHNGGNCALCRRYRPTEGYSWIHVYAKPPDRETFEYTTDKLTLCDDCCNTLFVNTLSINAAPVSKPEPEPEPQREPSHCTTSSDPWLSSLVKELGVERQWLLDVTRKIAYKCATGRIHIPAEKVQTIRQLIP